MNNEKTVIKKYTIMNRELCQTNDILTNNVNNYNRRFQFYEIVCKWKLVFDNDISIEVKSKVMYRISVLSHNLEKNLKNKINHYKRQGLEFSHISKMNITFKTRLDHMKYSHYLEQPMPMVERLFIRNLFNKDDLIKTLDGMDLTLHMGAYETGKADIYYSSDEE